MVDRIMGAGVLVSPSSPQHPETVVNVNGSGVKSEGCGWMAGKPKVEMVESAGAELGTLEAAPSTMLEETKSEAVAKKEPNRVDREDRPQLSYKDLIITAIESSPEKRLKLSEIYQVIRYLHPYYEKKTDQWGWQNSIRHNLSLHDCFVKLPMKQTSANGVVGHFWTVCRDREEKNPRGSARRRNRQVGVGGCGSVGGRRANRAELAKSNGHHHPNPNHHGLKERPLKGAGKERQSVSSSDSGVMSDESHSTESPTSALEAAVVCLAGTQQPQPSTSTSSASSTTGGVFDPATFTFTSGMPPYDWASCNLGNGQAGSQFGDVQLLVRKMQEAMQYDSASGLLSPDSIVAPPAPIPLFTSFSASNRGEVINQLSHLFGVAQLGRIGGGGADSIPNSMQSSFPHASDAMNIEQLKKLQLLNLYAQQQQRPYGGLNPLLLQHQMALDAARNSPTPVEQVTAAPHTAADPTLLSSFLAQILLAKLASPAQPPMSLAASHGLRVVAPTMLNGLVPVSANSTVTSLRPLPPSQLLINPEGSEQFNHVNNQYPLPTAVASVNEATLIKPIPRVPPLISDSAAGLSAEMQWQLHALQNYLASQSGAADIATPTGTSGTIESDGATSGVTSGDVMVA